jgi:hypothetical protein
MLEFATKLLIMCILPIHVESMGVPSNCTILEWNVGIYGFFSEDQKEFDSPAGLFDVIRAIAFFDLDFQSTWNSTLKNVTNWGPSWYVRSIDINPCLRFRPIIIDAPNNLKTNYMKAQVNSFWTFDAVYVDVLAYLPLVPAENVLHSGVHDKVSVGMLSSANFEDKQLYPYLFRYANPSGDDARIAYRYYVHFGWRSITMVNDESQDGGAKFQIFFALWTLNNHSTNSMNIRTVPSSSLPYQKSAINALIQMIQVSTTRLLYMDVEEGWIFANDKHCQPLNLNICLLRDMFAMNVKAPSFQFLVGKSFIDALDKRPGLGFDWKIPVKEHFHFTRGFALGDDHINFPWKLYTLLNQINKVNPSDYVDARMRYGMNEWMNGTWTNFWEEKVLRGEALVGWPSLPDIWRKMYWLGDVLAFILFALNDVMDTYQPTSKSQVTTKMMADAMSMSRPDFTAYGGTVPFTMPYPDQRVLSTSIVWQRKELTSTSYEDLPICCNGSYSRGGTHVFNDAIPVWSSSTGNGSWMPPSVLVNCTPGQFSKPNGLCEWCPAGRFSDTFDQTACTLCLRGQWSSEKSVTCEDCAVGRFGSELQMEDCLDCIGGTYASIEGQSLCTSCEFGKYSNVMAATGCNDCGGDLTTESKRSLLPTDCICPIRKFSRDFHTPNSSNGKVTSCEECMLGLDCETGWPSSWNAIGNPISLARPGFYTQASAPYDTYKCCFGDACEEDCPGGAPESCNPDRTGLVCDSCVEDGYFIKGAMCRRCPFLAKFLVLALVIGCSLVCLFAYYFTNGALTVDADNPLATILFLGLVVTSAQIFGIIKDLDITWPESLDEFMSGSSTAFALDAGGIPFECAVGDSPVALYMIQVLVPYVLLLVMLAMFAGSKLIARILEKPSISWESDKMMNSAGQLMQLLFIAFCAIMVKPLQCFRHPNGKWSLKMYPRVLCDEGGDHSGLLVLAACICFGFILPFVTWCVWGCLKAPGESSNANAGFLQRYRFLLYRFRPDCWWWGLCFLLRQTVLALVTILIVESPHVQLLYTGGALAVYGFLVCRFWPWISSELSFLDSGAMLILILVMLAAGQFLREPTSNKGRFGILITLFFSMGALLVRYIFLIMKSVLANGVFGEFGTGSPDRLTTSKEWLQWLEYMQDVPNSDIIETVCKMNGFDRCSIVNLMSSWGAVTRQGSVGKQMRLTGLPNKISVSKAKTSQISRQSSRVSQLSQISTSNEVSALGTVHDSSIGQGSVGTHTSAVVEDRMETDSEMCTV